MLTTELRAALSGKRLFMLLAASMLASTVIGGVSPDSDGEARLLESSLRAKGSETVLFDLYVRTTHPAEVMATLVLVQDGDLIARVPWRAVDASSDKDQPANFGFMCVREGLVPESTVRIVVRDRDSGQHLDTVKLSLADALEGEHPEPEDAGEERPE